MRRSSSGRRLDRLDQHDYGADGRTYYVALDLRRDLHLRRYRSDVVAAAHAARSNADRPGEPAR